MRWKNHILILWLSLGLGQLYGQIPDSIVFPKNQPLIQDTLPSATAASPTPLDSISTKEKKDKGFIRNIFSKEDYPNPKKALFLSFSIRGGGQIYNKRWWKLPFVYGGYTLLIIAIDYNTAGYRFYRDAYIAELAGEPHPLSQSNLDSGDLRRIRDGYDKNRQLSYIGLVAIHLVQTAEAFVDCHLKTFDVSDDLSMKIRPTMGQVGSGGTYFGLGLSFQLSD